MGKRNRNHGGGGADGERPIRLLLVEDHASHREALAVVLEREPDLSVAGQAATSADTLALLESIPAVDVALIDMDPGAGDAAPLISGLRERVPPVSTIALTPDRSLASVATAIGRGADGVFAKTSSVAELVDLIRRAGEGESLVPESELAEVVRSLNGRRAADAEGERVAALLTPREREILQSLAHGRSGREIAEQLSISRQTQRTHVTNILAKLGVHSQMQAVLLGLRYGLIRLPEV